MKNNKTKKIVFTAVFAALCCIATYFIVIPIPYGVGYVNFGDVFVLAAAWCLGGYGALAGIGCALADVLSGYAVYAPATAVIKVGMALIGYYLYVACKKVMKKEAIDFIPRLIAASVAELFMAIGYFLFEWAFYGFAAAATGIPFNILQGGCCAVCAVALFGALYYAKPVRNFFPALKGGEKDKNAKE